MSASSAAKPSLDSPPVSTHLHNQLPHSLQPPQQPHLKPSRLKLTYDIVMVIVISIDLLLISIDAILMSDFSQSAANWLTLSEALNSYRTLLHDPLRTAGGFFTLFLIVELLLRWAIAIKEQIYYRWFFFPFVHWYEVLEELSDRVILTTIHSYRQQLTDPKMQKSLIDSTFTRNRNEIEATLLSLLRQELAPKLQTLNSQSEYGQLLASDIGNAVQTALLNTPELHRLLRLIPIAGKLIEAQVLDIGHNIGENVVNALNECLLDPQRIDTLMVAISQGVAQIDTNNTALETLIARIFSESLAEFESNLKIQQWKHEDLLNF